MIFEVNLPFCHLKFYNNLVVSSINEGVALTQDLSDQIIEVALNHFVDQRFVYITHRINSYSVDPTVYFSVSQIENLLAFVVVSKQPISLQNTEIEKLFLDKTFELFEDLDTALSWSNKVIKKNSKLNEH